MRSRSGEYRRHQRKRIREGSRLPYAESAGIDPGKLKRYALDPDAEPGKAQGFATQLGIRLEDWDHLRDQILERLPRAEAVLADISNPSRTGFTVRVPVNGLNGESRVVITCWWVDAAHQPWLSTLWVTGERP